MDPHDPAGRPLVLLVDDDEIPRRITRDALAAAGFDVEEAANGRDGVAAFERLRPDLVLLDAVMPVLDGFVACAAIRALPEGRHTPILMMTALEDVESIRHAFEAGATDFATKPIHGSVLGFRVGHLIRAGRALEEVHRADGSYRALLQALPDLVLRVGRDGTIREPPLPQGRVRRGRYAQVLGRRIDEVLPGEAAEQAARLVERTLDAGGLQTEEIRIPERRRVRHLEVRAIASGPGEVVAFLRDVTRKRLREGRLAPLAFDDPETGLPNRARFIQRLEEELARFRRYEERFAVAILRFDLFREFVNEFGDGAGARVLRVFAGVLGGSLRETDMVARISPNEFGLLLTKLETRYSTTMVVRRILDLVSQGVSVDRTSVHFTACAGVSLAGPDGTDTVSSLLKQSDVALSRARRMGRNQVQFFTPEMSRSVSRRIGLEAELAEAVEKRRFVVHYQPAVELGTGRVVGAEALVRMVHPETGFVPPGEFIPLAEETGIIVAITDQVVREVCRQGRAWQDAGLPPLTLAVNLSGRDFQNHGLAAKVSGILREEELHPRHLEIEITESVAMHDFRRTLHTLQGLRDAGVRVAIDDFGTGYSSLAYLKRFPIQTLKIDRAFIAEMMENPQDRAIVDAIIGMAHAMSMDVLAEGVEREDQLRYLVGKGCDRAQGWHFGKPMPAAEMEAFLRRQAGAPGGLPSA
ncbi:MAG TPA: EAL domain-containing protein [Anaeromyxobacteraceae bacterium]|nr:EAL domain-containing protein [Anaeromyxobacteraceae bacterium]